VNDSARPLFHPIHGNKYFTRIGQQQQQADALVIEPNGATYMSRIQTAGLKMIHVATIYFRDEAYMLYNEATFDWTARNNGHVYFYGMKPQETKRYWINHKTYKRELEHALKKGREEVVKIKAMLKDLESEELPYHASKCSVEFGVIPHGIFAGNSFVQGDFRGALLLVSASPKKTIPIELIRHYERLRFADHKKAKQLERTYAYLSDKDMNAIYEFPHHSIQQNYHWLVADYQRLDFQYQKLTVEYNNATTQDDAARIFKRGLEIEKDAQIVKLCALRLEEIVQQHLLQKQYLEQQQNSMYFNEQWLITGK